MDLERHIVMPWQLQHQLYYLLKILLFFFFFFLGGEFSSLGDQNKGAMACVPRNVFGQKHQNCHISRKKKIGTRHIEHRFLYVANI